MKAYVMTTGLLFGAIALVHAVRVIFEPHLLSHYHYVILTLAAGLIAVWAWRVLRGTAAPGR